MVFQDYAMPQASDITSSITRPIVEAHNIELWPTLVTFAERNQFGGHHSKNPKMHLCNFLTECDIIKLNRVSSNAILLRLFSFSLKDRPNVGL